MTTNVMLAKLLPVTLQKFRRVGVRVVLVVKLDIEI
jgi:hypothetical protein